ncbi:hypothetical protein [Pedobacter mendelii]|uniref:Uncharacterized protein n=1 Tax=Pedobacter mendelii TaxID=1908240 RepID=A0ABQ2BDX3_9SPHI|nr:hypothetical protein [Pedobacter mendelii]GGI23699.1 hypothetical protein GCM10008119_08950 [Pedobacter mendelii]
MSANLKTIDVFETEYINLSEQLREELESKIENLYAKTRFVKYTHVRNFSYKSTTKVDFLCGYLIGRPIPGYVLSSKIVKGIKTWLNMYYDDRISVIHKFRTYYQVATPYLKQGEKPVLGIVFCKFLINELLTILSESRWKSLTNNTN